MPQSAAELAVGQDDETSDWELKPEQHARSLPAEAGALGRVLERAEIREIMKTYRTADAKAVAAQARYKRIGRLSLYAATVATITGALFLLPIKPWLSGPPEAIASVLQVSGLVVAFLASRYLAVVKPFDAWMKNRAEAEIARVALFDAVAAAKETTRGGEIPLLPLVLEYFRRYQLDVQRRYYRGRGDQHEAAAWRNNLWLHASLLFTAASVILGILLGLHVVAAWGLPVPAWLLVKLPGFSGTDANSTLLALGVVASALYGLGVAGSLMDLDERNASRFSTTSKNLEYLTETGLAAARVAAAGENTEAVLRFIAEVHEQISTEHREWVLLSAREPRLDRIRRTQGN
jgi:hypothetical protein